MNHGKLSGKIGRHRHITYYVIPVDVGGIFMPVGDNRFREFLFRKTKLRQIEGLVGYIRRMVLHAPPPAKWGKGV